MRITRVAGPEGPLWAALENGRLYHLRDPLSTDGTHGPELGPVADFRLLAPCQPGKVVGAAINYLGSTDRPPNLTQPVVFLKAPSSVSAPGTPIVSPFGPDTPVWGEAELAVVLGRRLSRATAEEARHAILGWTIGNDVTAVNADGRDHHLARSKSADTFCPLGPYIDTQFQYAKRRVSGFLNDVLVCTGLTDDFFRDPFQLLAEVSHWMTLEPFDVVLTGHPPLAAELPVMQPGDVYRARIEGFDDDLVNPFHGTAGPAKKEPTHVPA
ncbi:2-hydroxyhepta-2,4-diene-1,7-dioate isomerase [Streptomyces sp. SID4928]|uniref:fumarylacetoacetate hydrolase family protein n=1 Tax=unclassified Streptomyces TaxID=2593676 RepID=UPI0001C19C25|nr:fumarylacetoacetate hydrolase family protein [Streptomyces sp. ACT-1]EGE39621.1 fumarylacetoacetate (FAA) hydrolase [Streptomyces sp. ACT-1]MYR47710.1 2-hydroxyhepta-2,4-diene-1,7-dioate isomerase [Streptomyces sp. SID4928]